MAGKNLIGKPNEPTSVTSGVEPSSANVRPDPAADGDSNPVAEETVTLCTVHPSDVFRFGDADGDVIEGHKGKTLYRSAAGRVIDLANRNGVAIFERDKEAGN
jgi:hypothetical protein